MEIQYVDNNGMYNSKLNVSYKQCDDDDVYRKQWCAAFFCEDYNHDVFLAAMKSIVDLFIANEKFKKMITFSKETYQENEDVYALMYLFSWDHFEHLHVCLQDLYSKGDIEDAHLNWIS